MRADKQEILSHLRRRLFSVSVWGEQAQGNQPSMSLGLPAIDAILPGGGLPLGCLHEIVGLEDDGGALGFCIFWLTRLARIKGSILWIAERDDFYGHGLAALGLPLDRLIVAHPRRSSDALWTMETALRCRDLAAVVCTRSGALDFVTARRMQLAARASGVTAVLVRHGPGEGGPAVTRWRAVSAPAKKSARHGVAHPCWWVELVRCRGLMQRDEGYVDRWCLEWCSETHALALAAQACRPIGWRARGPSCVLGRWRRCPRMADGTSSRSTGPRRRKVSLPA